jgi:hypothetical protein
MAIDQSDVYFICLGKFIIFFNYSLLICVLALHPAYKTAYTKHHWHDYYYKTGMLALEQAFDCYAAKLSASKSKIATLLQQPSISSIFDILSLLINIFRAKQVIKTPRPWCILNAGCYPCTS